MSLLTSISIKNFKSLKDVRVDLGQLNVFIGENGVGKSNVLEAIGLLSTAVSGEMDYNRLSDRGVRLSTPEVFKSSFKNKARPSEIRIEAQFYKRDSYAVTILPDKKESRQQFFYKNESLEVGGERVAGRSHNGATVAGSSVAKPSSKVSVLISAYSLGAIQDYTDQLLSCVGEYKIYSPSTPILRGAPDDSRQDHLGLNGGNLALVLRSIGGKNVSILLSIMRKMFPWIKLVGVAQPIDALQPRHVSSYDRVVAFKDKFMKTNFNILYAYDVSEGALYVLFVLCLLLHESSPDFFALDNIDSTLNPGLVTDLVRHISHHLEDNSEKQIVLTSHNPTTLDALDLFDDRHRLFVVDRGEDGSTKVRRVAPPAGISRDRWAELVNNLKMSELWLSGAIGALHKV